MRAAGTRDDPGDRYILLLVAVIEQSRHDLDLPTRQRGEGNGHPTQAEKESAAEFLCLMRESALRRLIE